MGILNSVYCTSADGCFGKKKKKPIPHPGEPTPAPQQQQDQKKCALEDIGFAAKAVDNSGYDAKNGQASSQDDLKCDYEAPCAWKNTKPPYDTMEYVQLPPNPPPDKFNNYFHTSTVPSGNSIGTCSSAKADPSDKAEWESVVIPCSGDQIKVTLKHWVTDGVKLQVCQVSKNDPTTLLGCQDVPPTSPGPDTVSLPPGSDIVITIIASNFVSDNGGAAIIDDVTVEYPPCSSTGPAQTTTTAPGPPPPGATTTAPAPPTQPSTDELKKICCNFDSPCNWKKGSGPKNAKGKVNDWEQGKPPYFHNRATGVAPSPDKAFFGCYMKGGEACYTECDADINQEILIKCQEYKATQDVSLKICCDSEDQCTYETGKKTEKGDFRQWYQAAVKCPAGTKKVVVYAENTGQQEGGVGIDNCEVYDPSGNKIC